MHRDRPHLLSDGTRNRPAAASELGPHACRLASVWTGSRSNASWASIRASRSSAHGIVLSADPRWSAEEPQPPVLMPS